MKIRFSGLAALAAMFVFAASTSFAQKLTAEEVIAKHIDSIAPAETRAGLKTFITTGEVQVDYITQKNQPAKGRVVIASEGPKLFFGLQLNAADYAQELIVFDGNKHSVGFVKAGVRSDLGTFVQNNNELLTHGLLGGTLSTSWPLLNASEAKARIKYSGTKKVDGKESYVLEYAPKGGSDLEIAMFFDKETFRHVRTEYKRLLSSGIGGNIDQSARTSETRLKVTENFSDHREVHGMVVPHKYKLIYEFSGTNGTKEVEWTYQLLDFAVNQSLDAGTFNTGR